MGEKVAKHDRPDGWIHEEKKRPKQFMITEAASKIIDSVAKKLGVSRSEVIERAARCGGMSQAENFDQDSDPEQLNFLAT